MRNIEELRELRSTDIMTKEEDELLCEKCTHKLCSPDNGPGSYCNDQFAGDIDSADIE